MNENLTIPIVEEEEERKKELEYELNIIKKKTNEEKGLLSVLSNWFSEKEAGREERKERKNDFLLSIMVSNSSTCDMALLDPELGKERKKERKN